ncbi:hypothetical protein HDU78_010112 [Chytriomyces hyalinus]|nr:hypothetical protein HDU78_010112 [Chytriomyces hyalinus]
MSCRNCKLSGTTCDRVQPCCINCASVGAKCSYAVAMRCQRCRKQHRKCDMSLPTCANCFKANASCYYDGADMMQKIIHLTTSTNMELNYNEKDARLVDPDLAPSYKDYALLVAHPAANGGFIDWDAFMENFFLEPPPLRLVFCAHSAQMYQSDLNLSEMEVLGYYRRARKAVQQNLDKPSLRMVQALIYLMLLADDNGEADFADMVFEAAVRMILKLRMDVDPDILDPSSNLSESQKDEQRIIYGYCAYMLKSKRAVGKMPHFRVEMSLSQIKMPYHMAALPILSELCTFFTGCREVHTAIPDSVDSLIRSPKLLQLHVQIASVFCRFKPDEILMPSDGKRPLAHIFKDFSERVSRKLLMIDKNNLVFASHEYFTAICLLHRPRMYLLAHLPPNSPILQLYAQELETSLLEATNAAQHAALISTFQWLATKGLPPNEAWIQTVGSFEVPQVFSSWSWDWSDGMRFMEVATTLWFALCRVPAVWLNRIQFDRVAAQQGLGVILECCKTIDEGLRTGVNFMSGKESEVRWRPTLMTPVVQCITQMVLEVAGVAGASVNSIEVAMSVLSISDQDGDLETIRTGDTPLALMGLLGVEIKGGVRWRAPYEESWRRYWIEVQNGLRC